MLRRYRGYVVNYVCVIWSNAHADFSISFVNSSAVLAVRECPEVNDIASNY